MLWIPNLRKDFSPAIASYLQLFLSVSFTSYWITPSLNSDPCIPASSQQMLVYSSSQQNSSLSSCSHHRTYSFSSVYTTETSVTKVIILVKANRKFSAFVSLCLSPAFDTIASCLLEMLHYGASRTPHSWLSFSLIYGSLLFA